MQAIQLSLALLLVTMCYVQLANACTPGLLNPRRGFYDDLDEYEESNEIPEGEGLELNNDNGCGGEYSRDEKVLNVRSNRVDHVKNTRRHRRNVDCLEGIGANDAAIDSVVEIVPEDANHH